MSTPGAVHTAADLSTRTLLRTTAITVASLAAAALLTFLAREALFEAIAGAVERSPLGGIAGFIADWGMLGFVLAAGVGAVWTWVYSRARFWLLVTGGIGVIGAYIISELVKLIVTEQRPCRTLDVDVVLDCPALGDWSWPSNHSVLAAAFATALVLTFPWAARIAIGFAALIGLSRIAAGMHYLHDVLSGLALGSVVVVLVVLGVRSLVLRYSPGPR